MTRLRIAIILALSGLLVLGLGGYLRFETRMMAEHCIDWRSFTNTCRGPVWIGLAAATPETPAVRLEPGARIPDAFLRVLAQSAHDHAVCRDPGQPALVSPLIRWADPMPGCRKPG